MGWLDCGGLFKYDYSHFVSSGGGSSLIRLAVFDLDGTLLSGTKTVMPALAAALWKAGHRRGFGAWLFTLAGLAGVARKLRLISREYYTLIGTRLIVRWMARLSRSELEAVLTATAKRLLVTARPDVVAEVQARKAEGCRTVIVSAVVQPFLEHLAAPLGCEAVGSQVEIRPDGRLTGRLKGPYCSGAGKALALRAWADRLGEQVDWARSCAYADTLPDLPVLEAVGTAVAVAPELRLRQTAEQRGWRVMEG